MGTNFPFGAPYRTVFPTIQDPRKGTRVILEQASLHLLMIYLGFTSTLLNDRKLGNYVTTPSIFAYIYRLTIKRSSSGSATFKIDY